MAKVSDVFEYQIRELGVDLQTGDLPPCLGDANQVDQAFRTYTLDITYPVSEGAAVLHLS